MPFYQQNVQNIHKKEACEKTHSRFFTRPSLLIRRKTGFHQQKHHIPNWYIRFVSFCYTPYVMGENSVFHFPNNNFVNKEFFMNHLLTESKACRGR